MDTPDVPNNPTTPNHAITASAIYRSETTGAIRMTLKKMLGAPKNATTAYVFYCNEKQSSVVQIYPDRLKSDISKMMLAQWKKLLVEEKQPFADKYIGDKLRYQRDLEAFKVVVVADKVADLEESDNSNHERKKRKKSIEKFDRDATKRQRIIELNAS